MQPLARNGYTAAQVRSALTAETGVRTLEFRYELLNPDNTFKTHLTSVLSGSVSYDRDADIKRTAKFTIQEDGAIDYLKDRIRPVVQLKMPDDGYAEWQMGVFLLSSPTRGVDSGSAVIREVDAYDQLQVYASDLVTNRYSVALGVAYTAAVLTLLGSVNRNVTPSTKTLPVTMEWEVGTPKLQIINDLLAAINYESLIFDEAGRAVVRPYRSPGDRAPEYEYRDDDTSVILPGAKQSLDLFNVPTTWVLVVSDADRPALTSIYENNNPASPTSTVSRGRTITSFNTEQDAADQTSLDEKAARLAFEESQVYEEVRFQTGLMPQHSHDDVMRFVYSKMSISSSYNELGWDMELTPGGTMDHQVRRIVTVAHVGLDIPDEDVPVDDPSDPAGPPEDEDPGDTDPGDGGDFPDPVDPDPGEGDPGDDPDPDPTPGGLLVGFSGLAVNSICFLPDTSAHGARQFGQERHRAMDGLLYFVPRQNWNDLRYHADDHLEWATSGHILVITMPHAPESEGSAMNSRGRDNAYASQQQALGAYWASQGFNLENVYFRVNWEANGDWYRWNAGSTGGYVALRESIKNFVINMRIGGLTNAKFDLCWNNGPSQTGHDFDYFPGAAYIDNVSVDSYDWWEAVYTDADWTHKINRTPGLKTVRDFAVAHGITFSLDEGGNIHVEPGGNDNPFYWQKMWEFVNDDANKPYMMWHNTYNDAGAPDTLHHEFDANPNSWAYYKTHWGGF